jgi:spermidine/putrescine transport system permease protein
MKTNKKGRQKRRHIFMILFALIFLYLPIAVVILYSFNANASPTAARFDGFTLNWYIRVLHNATMLRSLGNSLLLAAFSVLIAVIIGTPAGLLISRYSFKGRGLLEKLSYLPLMLPEIILGISFLTYYSALRFPFGFVTMILAHTTFCIPYVMILVGTRMSGFDRSLEEAAKDLGAGSLKVFVSVILPFVALAVLSAALLAFVMSLDDVVLSFFTSGPRSNTLPLLIYSTLKTRPTPALNAICSMIIALVVIVLVLLNRINTIIQRRSR